MLAKAAEANTPLVAAEVLARKEAEPTGTLGLKPAFEEAPR
jgi:hypothetical protein